MQAAAIAVPLIMSFIESQRNKGEHGSTYTEGQQGGIEDLLKMLEGMGGNMDITQNPQYQQVNDYFQSMFNDPEFFKNIEAPMQRQFQEETIPGLANRFASMGSGGSLGSTAFRNQLGREGSNLHTNIAAMRENMKMGAIPGMMQSANQPFQNAMQMYQTALGHPTQNVYQPPSQGMWSPIAGAAVQGYLQNQGANTGGNTGGNAMTNPGGYGNPNAMSRNIYNQANTAMY